MNKPNIIFIQSDSMDGRRMGNMGHPALKKATLNMDRLASKGTKFSNAYSNNPICCPCRASMWSGLQTYNCEGWNNYKGLEKGDQTFATALQDNNYTFQTFGKTDYVSGNHTIRARVSPWISSAGIMCTNYNMGPPIIIEEQKKRVHEHDWNTIDKSKEWLDEHCNDTAPFMLYIGTNVPHPQFVTSRYYLNMLNLDEIKIPPKDTYTHPVMEYQKINKDWRHGMDKNSILKVRSIYFAMIAETDAMVGEIMDKVDQLGIGDNTYTIYSSDHGDNNMEHDQYYKMNMYESSERVPLIISGPNIEKDAVNTNLISLIDIFPTLMDMAKIDCPSGLDGMSLMPELEGHKTDKENVVFSMFSGTSTNVKVFMVRKDEYKYIAYPGYESMLFNLHDDPDEITNLAFDMPEKCEDMDNLLMSFVDYHELNDKIIKYDKASFRKWREQTLNEGTYQENMTRIFSGWDIDENYVSKPWTEENEKLIIEWLNK